VDTFDLRELEAIKGALTGSLSGRSNPLEWGAQEHLELIAKLKKQIEERRKSIYGSV
jgi:hypothetical protein